MQIPYIKPVFFENETFLVEIMNQLKENGFVNKCEITDFSTLSFEVEKNNNSLSIINSVIKDLEAYEMHNTCCFAPPIDQNSVSFDLLQHYHKAHFNKKIIVSANGTFILE